MFLSKKKIHDDAFSLTWAELIPFINFRSSAINYQITKLKMYVCKRAYTFDYPPLTSCKLKPKMFLTNTNLILHLNNFL